MATGETEFNDVTFDLISLQYHSLKAGHDYGQYVRDAKNAGLDDVASFFEDVMSKIPAGASLSRTSRRFDVLIGSGRGGASLPGAAPAR